MASQKGAHHGGAWKVAYADFVTAMMALFMVLWICAQSSEIQSATAEYFQRPFRTADSTSGVMPFRNGQKGSQAEETQPDREKQIEMTFLNSVAADFYRLLNLADELEDTPIDVQVTSDGLRVNVYDRASRPLFVARSTTFTEWGGFVMQSLAWMIERHRFRVTIDGHARALESTRGDDYSAWELSADRANAARRALVRSAVDARQIERVSGYSDTKPLPGERADAESNQRITIHLVLSGKRFKDSKMVEGVVPISQ